MNKLTHCLLNFPLFIPPGLSLTLHLKFFIDLWLDVTVLQKRTFSWGKGEPVQWFNEVGDENISGTLGEGDDAEATEYFETVLMIPMRLLFPCSTFPRALSSVNLLITRDNFSESKERSLSTTSAFRPWPFKIVYSSRPVTSQKQYVRTLAI